MKSVTIPTGTSVAWSGTFRSFVDGDIFRESNIDLNAGDLADRLAYLKDKADAAGYLATANAWTGENTFTTEASVTDFIVDGDGEMTVNASAQFNAAANFASEVATSGGLLLSGYLAAGIETLADAPATLSNVLVHRVPTLTANRVYTLPTGTDGQLALFIRPRTADAYTATLQNPAATTMGVISASNSGWILCVKKPASVWVVAAYGGTVTSVDTTV